MRPHDAEIISGFLAGQPEAVETVDTWIVQAARSFQRRLAATWDDVLQELRLEVTRLLREGQFRGRSSLRTYLSWVVSHTCLDKIRVMEKWHWTSLEDLEERSVNPLSISTDEIGGRESKDLLLRVLAEMSRECRALWSMIFQGFSYREMSDRLRVSPGALRVRVLRCRKKAVEVRDRILGDDEGEDARSRNVGGGTTPILNRGHGE